MPPTTHHPQPDNDTRPHSTDDIRDIYADLADKYARFAFIDRLTAGRYRKRHFQNATGRVLDVACGTGTNFPYLTAATDLVGIDLSPEMLAAAENRDRDAELYEMDAQNLAFPDNSFDTVISALSTCTFPDPVAALNEMARVCRPDGRILLLEHGESDASLLARYQHWRRDAHYATQGCRLTQEPMDHVTAANLTAETVDTALFGIITTIEATPN